MLSLQEEAKVESNRSGVRRTSDSPNSFNARRSLQLAREGCFGDALKTSGFVGCASGDDPVALLESENRHPHYSLPDRFDEIPPHSLRMV